MQDVGSIRVLGLRPGNVARGIVRRDYAGNGREGPDERTPVTETVFLEQQRLEGSDSPVHQDSLSTVQ